MEDPSEEEWEIDEGYLPVPEKGSSRVSWILNKGLGLGKKIVVTGILVSSAPLVLPPIVVISALGFGVSVPFGLVFASYACTEKLMSKLLPGTPPPSLLLGYGAISEREEEEEEEIFGEFVMGKEEEVGENVYFGQEEEEEDSVVGEFFMGKDEIEAEDLDFGGEIDIEREEGEEEPMEDREGGVEMTEEGSEELQAEFLPEDKDGYGREDEQKGKQESMQDVVGSVEKDGYEEDVGEYLDMDEKEPLEGGVDVKIEGMAEKGEEERGNEVCELTDTVMAPRVVLAEAGKDEGEVIGDEDKEVVRGKEMLLERTTDEADLDDGLKEKDTNSVGYGKGGENVEHVDDGMEEVFESKNVQLKTLIDELKGREEDRKCEVPQDHDLEEILRGNAGLSGKIRDEDHMEKLSETDNVQKVINETKGTQDEREDERALREDKQEDIIRGEDYVGKSTNTVGVQKVIAEMKGAKEIEEKRKPETVLKETKSKDAVRGTGSVDKMNDEFNMEKSSETKDVGLQKATFEVKETVDERKNDAVAEENEQQEIGNAGLLEKIRDGNDMEKSSEIKNVGSHEVIAKEEGREGDVKDEADPEENIREEIVKETTGLLEKIRDEGDADNTRKQEKIYRSVEHKDEKNIPRFEGMEKPIDDKSKKLKELIGEMKGMAGRREDKNVEVALQKGKLVAEAQGNRGEKINNNLVVDKPVGESNGKRSGKKKQKRKANRRYEMLGTRATDGSAANVHEGLQLVLEVEDAAVQNRDSKEVVHENVKDLVKDGGAAGEYDASPVSEGCTVLSDEKVSDTVAEDDVLREISVSTEAPKMKDTEIASETHSVASSGEVCYSKEKIWEKIDAVRMIVGYKVTPQSTFMEELKALYVFTGVEPPASFMDPDDLVEVTAKLRFLMSIIGVK